MSKRVLEEVVVVVPECHLVPEVFVELAKWVPCQSVGDVLHFMQWCRAEEPLIILLERWATHLSLTQVTNNERESLIREVGTELYKIYAQPENIKNPKFLLELFDLMKFLRMRLYWWGVVSGVSIGVNHEIREIFYCDDEKNVTPLKDMPNVGMVYHGFRLACLKDEVYRLIYSHCKDIPAISKFTRAGIQSSNSPSYTWNAHYYDIRKEIGLGMVAKKPTEDCTLYNVVINGKHFCSDTDEMSTFISHLYRCTDVAWAKYIVPLRAGGDKYFTKQRIKLNSLLLKVK
jgi:hypothetical protein